MTQSVNADGHRCNKIAAMMVAELPIVSMSASRTFETLASVKIIEFATQNAFAEYSDELLSY